MSRSSRKHLPAHTCSVQLFGLIDAAHLLTSLAVQLRKQPNTAVSLAIANQSDAMRRIALSVRASLLHKEKIATKPESFGACQQRTIGREYRHARP